jgi:pSer/pThr/pTyr-binding forkhead associated (FHA) protein
MVFGAPVGATQVFKPGLAKLAITSGNLSGNVFPLGVPGDSETSIGRKVDGSTVRVQIDSPFVSRRHARIYAESDQLFLADQQSASGTKLNGEKVTAPMKLKVGDKIEFADTTAEIKPI